MEASHLMQGNAAQAATSAGGGYVDFSGCCKSEAPKRGCASVAKQGPVTAGEHSCHPPAVCGQVGMTDRIDLSMNPVQPANIELVTDSSPAEAELEELASSDHAMLAAGEPSQLNLTWSI